MDVGLNCRRISEKRFDSGTDQSNEGVGQPAFGDVRLYDNRLQAPVSRCIQSRIRKLFRTQRLVRSLRAESRKISENLDNAQEMRSAIDANRDKAFVDIVNIYQFVLICRRDVTLLTADVIESKDRLRTQLYLRVLALVLSEFFDDMKVLFNNQFRQQFDSLFPDLRSPFRSVSRKFNRLGEDHSRTLRAIRNTIIAHRDHDVPAQIAAIAALDRDRILDLAMAVNMWQAAFVVLWIPVTSARMRVTRREWLLNGLRESAKELSYADQGPTGSTRTNHESAARPR